MSREKRVESLPTNVAARERMVALRFMDVGNVQDLAIHFGVSRDQISDVMCRSRTVELIRKYSLERLISAVPAAVSLLQKVVTERDPNRYGVKNQLVAAKMILDRTDTKIVRDEGNANKELNEMSREEIQAEIERLENESAERATNITPKDAQNPDDLADLL